MLIHPQPQKKRTNKPKPKLIFNDYKDILYDEESVAANLKNFKEIATKGHVFLKRSRNNKDKKKLILLRIKWNESGETPLRLYWGSGTRHLTFRSLKFIAQGHVKCYNEELDDNLCFCAVEPGYTLNVESRNKYVTALWVKGIQGLMDHIDWISNKYFEEHQQSQKWADYIEKDSDDSHDSSDDETRIKVFYASRERAKIKRAKRPRSN